MKTCTTCLIDKVETEFSIHTACKGNLRSSCRKCCSNRAREYNVVNKKRTKNTALLRKYGITLDVFEQMLEDQDGTCDICLTRFEDTPTGTTCVDHCHTTGKVRGLLCFNCNTTLGKMDDSIENLQRALDYLIERG